MRSSELKPGDARIARERQTRDRKIGGSLHHHAMLDERRGKQITIFGLANIKEAVLALLHTIDQVRGSEEFRKGKRGLRAQKWLLGQSRTRSRKHCKHGRRSRNRRMVCEVVKQCG